MGVCGCGHVGVWVGVLGDRRAPLCVFKASATKCKKVVGNLNIACSDGPNWERGFETSLHEVGLSPRLIFSSLMHREKRRGGEGGRRANISNRPQTVNDNEPERDRSLTALRKRGDPGEGMTAEVCSITKKKNNFFFKQYPLDTGCLKRIYYSP